MRHISTITANRPMPALVRQGPFLSILEVVLDQLVKQLDGKKEEKDAETT